MFIIDSWVVLEFHRLATPYMDSNRVFRSLKTVYRLSMKRTSLFLARKMLVKLRKIGVGTPEIESVVYKMFGLQKYGDTSEEQWFYRRYRVREVRRLLDLRMMILNNLAQKRKTEVRNKKYEIKILLSEKSYRSCRDFCRILRMKENEWWREGHRSQEKRIMWLAQKYKYGRMGYENPNP